MDKEKFARMFLDAMEVFLEMSYRPPGMDKLKDADTHAGFRACLRDEDFVSDFVEAFTDG